LSCTETFSTRLADEVKLVEEEGECDRRLTEPESPEIGAVVGLLAELPVGGLTLGLEAERNFPEHRNAAVSVLIQVTSRLSP
jgi:hypothetical protein